MIRVKLPDGSFAQFPDGTPPEVMTQAIQAKFGAPTQAGNGGVAASDPSITTGLAIPGTTPTRGYQNEVPSSERFGLSQSDTLNPFPAVNAFGNSLAAKVPILGPTLQSMGENFDASVDNAIYRPLTGNPGVTTPQDVRATNERQSAANPQAKVAGELTGAVAPYLLASRIPGAARLLGMEGPVLQRILATFGSQELIGTLDNAAHGQQLPEAAANALVPSLVSAPFGIFGRRTGGAAPVSERDRLVQALEGEGVPLTAGQRTGNKTLQYAESELGGGAATAFEDRQKAAFTRAALERAGVNTDRATPEVMDSAYRTLGNYFDRLAALTDVPLDAQLQNDMLDAVSRYQNVAGTPARAPEFLMNRVAELSAQNGGVLRGEAYQNIRSEMGEMLKSADGPTTQVLVDLREALDDAVERNMSPQLLEAWQVVRSRYRNLVDITDAVTRSAENATGVISPANLRGALTRSNRRGYARGAGDLSELARSGEAAMSPLPQSGTAPRTSVRNLASTPGALVAALAGHDVGGLAGGLAAGSAAWLAPYLMGRGALSGAGRDALSGRGALAASQRRPEIAAIARGLIEYAR